MPSMKFNYHGEDGFKEVPPIGFKRNIFDELSRVYDNETNILRDGDKRQYNIARKKLCYR